MFSRRITHMFLCLLTLGSLLLPGAAASARQLPEAGQPQRLTSPVYAPAVDASDFGDAPDSTNAFAAPMDAYPGVPAQFPTALSSIDASGPMHLNATPHFFTGKLITAEDMAESGTDEDGFTNIDPQNNAADRDQQDDGLTLPPGFDDCQPYTLTVRITALPAMPPNSVAYLNLWADWNRSGAWGDANALTCDGTPVSEWAVQNFVITLAGAGLYKVQLPTFLASNRDVEKDIWLRLSLSDSPAPAADGRGPTGGYQLGETEDYRLEGALRPVATATPPIITPVEFTASNPEVSVLYLSMMQGGSMPGGFTTPPGKPNEVDVAYIGGDSFMSTKPVVVTAAGGGANFRLASWRVLYEQEAPIPLKETAPMAGFNVRLHTLLPDISPGLSYNLLVSGYLRSDGNLYLTTWRVGENGNFTKLSTRGYGSNAEVQVKNFAIAHREIVVDGAVTGYQIATPVLTQDGSLRLVTWSVNPDTGVINGKQDTADWGNPDPDTPLQAAFLSGSSWSGPHFVVGYQKADGKLNFYSWYVSNAGMPSYIGQGDDGSGRSAVDIRGTDDISLSGDDLALASLNETGFMAAVVNGAGTLYPVDTFSNQLVSCSDTGCIFVPHQIADSSLDLDGNYGVTIAAPSTTAFQGQLSDASVSGGDVVYQWPAGGFTQQGIASVTKIMTVIVALDQVSQGNVSLDDEVTVSAAAAATGGSSMDLLEGEVQTLRALLHGLMINSGNDAGRAIAEHISGTVANFAVLMNDKVSDLGLANTTYCDAWGGCPSTPADQVTLWLAVYDDPLFQEFLGSESYDACGKDKDGEDICHFMSRNVFSVYPGLDSWKGGSLGFFCGPNGIPLCTSGGCLSTQATRLERTLMLNLLNPQGQPDISRWDNARNLFDYGYRQIFTPDYIGSNPAATEMPAQDMALDGISGEMVVTAVIDENDHLKICSWMPSVPTSQVEPLGCATQNVKNLTQAAQYAANTLVDMSYLSMVEFDGSYVIAQVEGGDLKLTYWLVGKQPW